METYTVQVEGVGPPWCTISVGEVDFDGLVNREGDDAPFGHQLLRRMRAAQDLQQDRHLRRVEGVAIDEEVGGGLLYDVQDES